LQFCVLFIYFILNRQATKSAKVVFLVFLIGTDDHKNDMPYGINHSFRQGGINI